MTEQLQQKTIIDPELSDVLALQKLDVFASLNCVKIGQITAFDGETKTATIQILFKRQLPDGKAVSYPVLLDCPVFTLQGGGGLLQMPIAAGDQCIVLFSDRCIDNWYQNGSQAVPSSTRMHDMSDGIALVGINALNSDLPTYPTDRVTLSYQGTSFEVTSTGWNFVGVGGAEITIDDDIDLTANAGGEIALTDKVLLKNNATTLLTLLNGLIDVIAAATVQTAGTPPLTAVTIAALQAYKVQLATLLG